MYARAFALANLNSNLRLMKTLTLGLLTLMLSTIAQAHHTSLAIFDPTATTEIEGVVTDVHWSNPHVRLDIGVADAAGDITEWNIELTSLSAFRSRGYATAFVEVGEKVKVYGNPAKSGLRLIFWMHSVGEIKGFICAVLSHLPAHKLYIML